MRPPRQNREWRSLLSEDELQRAQRFHFDRDRKHFCAARGLLRTVLSGYLAVPAKDIAFRYLEKGKPELAAIPEAGQLNFNVSHSGELRCSASGDALRRSR